MAKNNNSKSLGDLLEDVVGLLHEGPGWVVEKKARVRVIGSERETAEIDVLISGQIAGYTVRIAIECKNWGKKVESGQINEFVGKLEDVGIPRVHGVYVSASGYTKGALRRAVKEGIKPLEITGLNKDRLTSAVERAFRHLIYLIPHVESVQVFGDRADEPNVMTTMRYMSPLTGRPVYALDHLWKKWFFGECPAGLGLHHMRFDIPQDSELFAADEEKMPKVIFFGLRVIAAVVSVEGKLTDHGLRDARSQALERRRLFLDFAGAEKHAVRVFDTEDKLASYLQSNTTPSLTIGRIRLPRIIYEPVYWPPTPGALLKASEIQRQGRTLTFKEIEGTDLSRAWEFLSSPEDLEDIRDDLVEFKIYP